MQLFRSWKKESLPDAGYWDSDTGAWDSPDEIFYPANLDGNSWTATGSSSPTWIAASGGVYYRIFARAEMPSSM